jgi:hypothetical protein
VSDSSANGHSGPDCVSKRLVIAPEIPPFAPGTAPFVPAPPVSDRKPPVSGPRLAVRLAGAAYGWVLGLADHCSLSVTDLVWQALMRQADASGYHHRVPPRIVRKPHPNRREYPNPEYPRSNVVI